MDLSLSLKSYYEMRTIRTVRTEEGQSHRQLLDIILLLLEKIIYHYLPCRYIYKTEDWEKWLEVAIRSFIFLYSALQIFEIKDKTIQSVYLPAKLLYIYYKDCLTVWLYLKHYHLLHLLLPPSHTDYFMNRRSVRPPLCSIHSHWSRNVEALLSLVRSFIVMLHQLSNAIKNQLVASKAPRWFFMA